MDRLISLAVFASAVEEGSLAAAARRHRITAAMAGRHVASLEAATRVRLLHRTTRRLHLTDAGRGYYRRCRRILDEFDEAQREAGASTASPRGTLRIAAPVSFGVLHLGAPIARYLHDHPDLRAEVLLNDRFIDLIHEGIDLAIRIGRLPDSTLGARRIGTCRMVLCATPAYLERHGLPRTPEELREHPRLAFSESVSPGDWTLVDPRGQSHVVAGEARLLANNMDLLRAAAMDGIGVAYGPSFVFGPDLSRGSLVPIMARYRAPDLGIHAVMPTAQYMPTKVRLLIDRLADEFGDDPPWDEWRTRRRRR